MTRMLTTITTSDLCKLLPKIELHAHLNGSISEATLKKLGCPEIINKTNRTMAECFDLFKVVQKVTKNQNSVYLATQSVIRDFAEDNVIYLELRTTPRAEEGMRKEEYIESVVKAIKNHTYNILVKLILSIDRRHDTATSRDDLKIIVKMKDKYPDIIKGIDLSGDPMVGMFDEEIFQKARENGLKTALHCAEIKNDEEVEKILLFVADRIGHGTFLHPNYGGSKSNWELYCRHKIPVECCVTSNVLCGTPSDHKSHHIQEWITNSLPFSINTDDKGIFGTTQSREYENVMKHFNLTPKELWQVSYNAVSHSFASTEEKKMLEMQLVKWFQDSGIEKLTGKLRLFVVNI